MNGIPGRFRGPTATLPPPPPPPPTHRDQSVGKGCVSRGRMSGTSESVCMKPEMRGQGREGWMERNGQMEGKGRMERNGQWREKAVLVVITDVQPSPSLDEASMMPAAAGASASSRPSAPCHSTERTKTSGEMQVHGGSTRVESIGHVSR